MIVTISITSLFRLTVGGAEKYPVTVGQQPQHQMPFDQMFRRRFFICWKGSFIICWTPSRLEYCFHLIHQRRCQPKNTPNFFSGNRRRPNAKKYPKRTKRFGYFALNRQEYIFYLLQNFYRSVVLCIRCCYQLIQFYKASCITNIIENLI